MLFLKVNIDGRAESSSYEHLHEMIEAVEAAGEHDGWPPDLAFKVTLVVDELSQNVIDYSCTEGLNDVLVELTTNPDEITVEVIDDGIPFNPLTDSAPPDLTSAIEDRDPGGLGVHFTKTLMDDVQYSRVEGKNRVKITARKPR
ncbi:MAG: ATP-binding protein [Acidimicrobiaceae bacterium]|nr:ATP-binding protein [Acidimicrobiaceae bacterium]MCY4174885.1 ATP-binding protein [Acidimicrobiaceae bacterium]MCY4280364.1 ATP-binding protein [Acidimicrobiaceae bacterium]